MNGPARATLRRDTDKTTDEFLRFVRRWSPLFALFVFVGSCVSCIQMGFTLTGWRGQTPAARFDQLGRKIDTAVTTAHRETGNLKLYVDSNVVRLSVADSIALAERRQLQSSMADAHRMMEDLLVLTCAGGTPKSTRMTTAICDRYLSRRGF